MEFSQLSERTRGWSGSGVHDVGSMLGRRQVSECRVTPIRCSAVDRDGLGQPGVDSGSEGKMLSCWFQGWRRWRDTSCK